jgi:hypothetical protein
LRAEAGLIRVERTPVLLRLKEDFNVSDDSEIKSPFLRKAIEQRGIYDDLVTDLLIVERYLRRPELADSVVALMLRSAIKAHPLETEIVGCELKLGRGLTEPEMKEIATRREQFAPV